MDSRDEQAVTADREYNPSSPTQRTGEYNPQRDGRIATDREVQGMRARLEAAAAGAYDQHFNGKKNADRLKTSEPTQPTQAAGDNLYYRPTLLEKLEKVEIANAKQSQNTEFHLRDQLARQAAAARAREIITRNPELGMFVEDLITLGILPNWL